MGLRGGGDDPRAALHAHPAPHAHGRAAARALRPHLLLLRGGDPALPRAGQRRHDRRSDARDGHPAPVPQLRRLVARGLHHPTLHRRAARRLDAAVLTQCLTTTA